MVPLSEEEEKFPGQFSRREDKLVKIMIIFYVVLLGSFGRFSASTGALESS